MGHHHDHHHDHHHGNSESAVGCRCPHHRLNGLLVALAGLAYLLGNLEIITMHLANTIWPICVIIVGLNKSVGRYMCKCCKRT